jgi:hypothetical protein
MEDGAKRPAVKGYLRLGADTSSQLALKFGVVDSFGFASAGAVGSPFSTSIARTIAFSMTRCLEMAPRLSSFGPAAEIIRLGTDTLASPGKKSLCKP